ncbi:hypothetical protein GE09DRAFT_1255814 [Coniochaeta sp. 2T2.1]|nr:hypothetical protein GE09DRAFT_1255814 [Coniochaeta sp. 2T2.1]
MGDRSSPDIDVGAKCHVQKASRRFGAMGAEDIKAWIWTNPASVLPDEDEFDEEDDGGEGSDDESEDDETASDFAAAASTLSITVLNQEDDGQDLVELDTSHHKVPRAARARSNLTVLSQRYNLYFAAYQNKIYVYQPQRPPQILPQVSLILRPPQSEAAKLTGGVLDRAFPHQMNYITVGDLGNLEILLVAFDDGDLVAYYTHQIVQIIEARDSPHGWNVRPVLRPFFHESVGSSAWGLAIHTQSRLIAASSNRHDVTVFAFALAHGGNAEGEQGYHSYATLWTRQSVLELEKHFRSRTRTWRVVLPIGYDGHNNPHNIPSIAFCDDSNGNAERVAAVDINGNTWLLDIWNIGQPALLIKPNRNMLSNTARRQVILHIPGFKPAVSNHAAMGLPANEILGLNNSTGDGIKNDLWLDISGSLHHVNDNASDPKIYLLHGQHLQYSQFSFQGIGFDLPSDTPIPSDDDTDDDPSNLLVELLPAPSPAAIRKPQSTHPSIEVNTFDLAREPQMGFELGLTIVPGRSDIRGVGQVSQQSTSSQLMDFFRQSSTRESDTKVVEMRHVRLPSHFCSDFSILRATATGVELQSLDPKAASVLCRDVLPHHNHNHRRVTPWDLSPAISERISMYLHVPELGLVVLGSLNGRVALLSLTKPPRRHGFGSSLRSRLSGDGIKIKRAFRVEAVLPRRQDENKGLRPWCTLHGIAISPVPDHRAKGLAVHAGAWRPKVWRLILHYIDHTILMYDISRHEGDGDLMII